MEEKDNISAAFEKINEMMQSEDGQKQISDIISMLSTSPDAPDTDKESDESEGLGDLFSGLDLGKLKSFLNPDGAAKGRGESLISAIKPFLKEERREKLDGAAKILSAASLFKQLGLFKKGDD